MTDPRSDLDALRSEVFRLSRSLRELITLYSTRSGDWRAADAASALPEDAQEATGVLEQAGARFLDDTVAPETRTLEQIAAEADPDGHGSSRLDPTGNEVSTVLRWLGFREED